MLAAVLAAGLQLQLVQIAPPAVNQPQFINLERQNAHDVVVEDPDHPLPKRSTAWVAAGGFGMAGLGAGIGAVMAQAFSRSSGATALDTVDTHAGMKGMALGALLGLVPGLIFGNEARNEGNAIGRTVILLTDLGGALAIGMGWAQSHSRLTF